MGLGILPQPNATPAHRDGRTRPWTQLISEPACQIRLMGSHRASLGPSTARPMWHSFHCSSSRRKHMFFLPKGSCVLFHTHFCPSRPAHSVAGFSCSLGALHPPPPNHPPLPRVPTDGGLEPARSPSTTVTRQLFLQINPSFCRMFT